MNTTRFSPSKCHPNGDYAKIKKFSKVEILDNKIYSDEHVGNDYHSGVYYEGRNIEVCSFVLFTTFSYNLSKILRIR